MLGILMGGFLSREIFSPLKGLLKEHGNEESKQEEGNPHGGIVNPTTAGY
jgi:hypothetical protein